MIKRLIYIAIITLGTLTAVPAHAQDWSPLGGIIVTPSASYDSQAKATAAGVDINIIVAGLNAGITYRHWDDAIAGWDGTNVSADETTIYFGFGLVNVIQIQAGYSGSGASMRIRSDLALLQDRSPFIPSLYSECAEGSDNKCREKNIPRSTLILSPYIEFTPFEDNHKTVYGLSMGVVF